MATTLLAPGSRWTAWSILLRTALRPRAFSDPSRRFGTLEKVYGAITFYLANKESVEAYLQEQEQLASEIRARQMPLPETLANKLRRVRQEALPRSS